MQTIEIRTSRTARKLVLLLMLAVPFALWRAGLAGWWLGAAAWLAALGWAWRGVAGLGAPPLTLRYRPAGGWEVRSAGDPPGDLTRVRPVLVGPRLILAELTTEHRRHALVVAPDAGPPEDLRRLRQLLLSGPAAEGAQSAGRGT